MKNASLKRSAGALAFAAATALPALAFALPDDTRGPSGAADYAALVHTINDIGNTQKLIGMKERTVQVLGTADSSIPALKSKLAAQIEETPPKILLTGSISEQDVANLITLYTDKVGNVPAYLSDVGTNTGNVHDCQKRLLTADAVRDMALAVQVSDCAASLHEMPQAQKKAPVQATPAAPRPVQTQTQGPAPAKSGGVASAFSAVSPKTIGLGVGGLVLALGAGGFIALRRKPKKDAAPSKPAGIDL